MGWNEIIIKKDDALFANMSENPRFYFVHSYYLKCDDKNDVLAVSDYGKEFVSAIQKENIYGVQFHPEAMPGPVDTEFLFDEFVKTLK